MLVGSHGCIAAVCRQVPRAVVTAALDTEDYGPAELPHLALAALKGAMADTLYPELLGKDTWAVPNPILKCKEMVEDNQTSYKWQPRMVIQCHAMVLTPLAQHVDTFLHRLLPVHQERRSCMHDLMPFPGLFTTVLSDLELIQELAALDPQVHPLGTPFCAQVL